MEKTYSETTYSEPLIQAQNFIRKLTKFLNMELKKQKTGEKAL